jgi:hypothetical protein
VATHEAAASCPTGGIWGGGRRQAPARDGARVLGALEMGIFGWDPQAGEVHVHGDGVGGSV